MGPTALHRVHVTFRHEETDMQNPHSSCTAGTLLSVTTAHSLTLGRYPRERLCDVTWSSRLSYVIGLRGKTRAKAI